MPDFSSLLSLIGGATQGYGQGLGSAYQRQLGMMQMQGNMAYKQLMAQAAGERADAYTQGVGGRNEHYGNMDDNSQDKTFAALNDALGQGKIPYSVYDQTGQGMYGPKWDSMKVRPQVTAPPQGPSAAAQPQQVGAPSFTPNPIAAPPPTAMPLGIPRRMGTVSTQTPQIGQVSVPNLNPPPSQPQVSTPPSRIVGNPDNQFLGSAIREKLKLQSSQEKSLAATAGLHDEMARDYYPSKVRQMDYETDQIDPRKAELLYEQGREAQNLGTKYGVDAKYEPYMNSAKIGELGARANLENTQGRVSTYKANLDAQDKAFAQKMAAAKFNLDSQMQQGHLTLAQRQLSEQSLYHQQQMYAQGKGLDIKALQAQIQATSLGAGINTHPPHVTFDADGTPTGPLAAAYGKVAGKPLTAKPVSQFTKDYLAKIRGHK